MTTIAYAAGVLVTDSASTYGTVHTGTVRKAVRTPDGCLVAACGSTLACGAIYRWAEEGMVGNPGIDLEGFTALLIRPDGKVYLLGGDGTEVCLAAPFYAIGSGREIALGAMAAGADAEHAVHIACRFDGASREPVQILRLGE